MSFEEALHDLERRGIMPLRAPTLDNTQAALARFDLKYPADLKKIVSVAGTNGKGSTSKTLESLLRAAGRRTGLYTSPHLVDYRERIMVDGEMISKDLFEIAWRRVRDTTQDLPLSHFEVLTVMAAWIFFSGEAGPIVDHAIFEVGLGGLWDATNAVPHQTALICQLGLDHQELLGRTLPEIAANKFGIVTPGCLVLHQPFAREVQGLAIETARRTTSEWHEVPPCRAAVETSERIPRDFLESDWGRAAISLPGLRGAQNMNLALFAFAQLGFDPRAHLDVLQNVRWPARMQNITELIKGAPCPVFLSGDHNPQGVESLLEILRNFKWRELRLVIGVGIKKDLAEMLEKLLALPRARVWLTRSEFQGRDREQYGEWLTRAEDFNADPIVALAAALDGAHADDLCLITGSLYLSGDVLRKLLTEATEGTAAR